MNQPVTPAIVIRSLCSALILFVACTAGFNAKAATSGSGLPRLALVIGNQKYTQTPLTNAHNDANAIAAQLKNLGFDVTLRLDAGKSEMENLIRTFGTRLHQQSGIGLFYFAGHGAQVNWRNYLIPVDATVARVGDIQNMAVDLGALLKTFQFARNPVNIVILDACRDNPFGDKVRLDEKGLSQIDAPPGTLLAYATAPGNVASDGSRSNGLYTEHLLNELAASNTKIEDVFKRVRLSVRRESGGRQIPWESTSLEHDFYFNGSFVAKKTSIQDGDKLFEEEAAQWDKIANSKDRAALESYLHRYPSGHFSELAQFRLDRLLAEHGEKRVDPITGDKNPFSKGTTRIDTRFAVGDEYRYRRIDRVAGTVPVEIVNRVTKVSDAEIIFNDGKLITDPLGNSISSRFGNYERGRQYLPVEYAVGKTWTTRFSAVNAKGTPLNIEIDFKIVSREPIVVAGQTFNAYKIEGVGSNNVGADLRYEYWMAPDRVRRPLMFHYVWRDRTGRLTVDERNELLAYRQLRDPASTK